MKNLVALLTACLVICFAVSSCTVAKPQSKFKHEQHWIVDSIGRDISQIMLFAASKTKSDIKLESMDLQTGESEDRKSYQYTLNWTKDGKNEAIAIPTFSTYIWDPSNYTALVKQLSTQLALTPNKSEDSSAELIEKLANFDEKTLVECNQKVADKLNKSPLDAEANEEAALLCSLYALRESAACLSDHRPWLNRICTHLAIAEAGRAGDKAGQAGVLSKMVLLCLAGRQADSLELVSKMETETMPAGSRRSQESSRENSQNSDSQAGLQSWLRAIKTRATHDSRIADKKNGKMIELLEYGRSIADNQGSDAVTDYLGAGEKRELPIDWMRIGMRGHTSVESGHIYSENSVKAELEDCAKDLLAFKKSTIKNFGDLIKTLKEDTGGCMVKQDDGWHPQPVSWNTLSQYHNRHLLDAVYQTYDFFENDWGVHDEAKKLLEESDKSFSELALYPVCKIACRFANKEQLDADLSAQFGRLAFADPQLISFHIWHGVSEKIASGGILHAELWFYPICPIGTTFDYDYRRPGGSVPVLESFTKLNPYDRQLLHDYARKKFGKQLGGAPLAEIYAPILAYDVRAMQDVCDAYWKQNDKENYAKSLEQICKFNPNKYFLLGDMYENKNPEKAFSAYENGVKHGRNVVQMSNSCFWLVDYYYDHGKKDKAIELAEKVGEVYSHTGLMTLAHLNERMGKLAEAEDVYNKIKERYESDDDLTAFYLRHANDKPEYKSKAEGHLKETFPQGMKKLDSKSTAAPHDGIKVTSTSFRTDDAGIRANDVIVAVNGWQVGNQKQYTLVRELALSPDMEFTVWDNEKKTYRTAKVKLCDHRLGCDIDDYQG